MADPIGVTFIPSADALAQGPKQAAIEGGPGASDLSSAFKVLSLHLPQVLGAAALSPRRLLTSPGAAGLSSAGISAPDAGAGSLTDPNAQAFLALIKAMLGGGFNPSGSSMAGPMGASGGGTVGSGASAGGPAPKIDYADGPKAPDIYGGGSAPPAPAPSAPPAASPSWAGNYDNGGNERTTPESRYI